VVKTILYKRTIALGTSIDFRKDLRKPRGDSGWRKEAEKTGGKINNITEKTPRERPSAAEYRDERVCVSVYLCVRLSAVVSSQILLLRLLLLLLLLTIRSFLPRMRHVCSHSPIVRFLNDPAPPLCPISDRSVGSARGLSRM